MSTRQNKVRELLKEEISDILLRDLKDPRLGFITITDVEVTGDLQHARVFVSVMGSDTERAENLAVLKRAQHFVRESLKRRISMKVLPDVEFRLDNSVDHAIRMLELMEQIKHNDEERSA